MRKLSLLVPVLVACGGGDSPDPDGPPQGGPIVVHVDRGDMPAAGIDVVFHDAGGEVVSVTQTGADGTVATEDGSVEMATIVYLDPVENTPRAFTKTGLRAGDTPWFTIFVQNSQPPPFSQPVQIDVPPNPPGGATTFAIDFGCQGTSGASTSLALTLTNDCRRPGREEFDVLLLAKNGETVTGFSFMKDVTFAASGSTAINFPDGWRTDTLMVSTAFSNLPATATEVRMSFHPSLAGTSYFQHAPQLASVPPPMRTYIMPRGFYSTVEHMLEVNHGGTSSGFFIERGPAPPQNTGTIFNVGDLLLPAITGVQLADGTTDRPSITWQTSGSPDGAGGGFAGFGWATGFWSFQFRPGLTSLRVPALPDELAQFRPPADGSIASPFVQYRFLSYAPTYSDELALHGRFDGEEAQSSFSFSPGMF
jgi:hypothetical protein